MTNSLVPKEIDVFNYVITVPFHVLQVYYNA